MKLYLLNFTTKALLLKNVMSIYENYGCLLPYGYSCFKKWSHSSITRIKKYQIST